MNFAQWMQDARNAHSFDQMEWESWGYRVTRYDEQTGFPSQVRKSPPLPFWLSVIRYAFWDIHYHWRMWNCDHSDSMSYADPENGYEEVTCRRCGWSFSCYH
jgi:hypothetical protein